MTKLGGIVLLASTCNVIHVMFSPLWSFVCAEEGEAGNEATPLVNARILSSTGEVTGSSGVSGVRWPARLALQCCTSLVMESRKACLT